MELIERVLKKYWPTSAEDEQQIKVNEQELGAANDSQHPKGPHWIQVDTCENDGVGAKILEMRMRDGTIDTSPIILYGFKSFENLVRSEKRYPGLLTTPGVFYLRLPAPLSKVQRTLYRAKHLSLDAEKVKADLIDSALAGNRLEKMESVLAHNMGNFLGPEKLVFGAHLAGKINAEDFNKTLDGIRNKQKNIHNNSPEYLLYRLSQVDYDSYKNPACDDNTEIKGTILYIDDHSHLGWAQAVASSLWGKNTPEHPDSPDDAPKLDVFKYPESQLLAMRARDLSVKEDDFFNNALEIVGNDRILESVDLFLLDLRLRWKKDENVSFDELSGIQVLDKIRKTNAAIPVIMLTASRKAQNLETVLDKGADDYFIKEIPRAQENYPEIRKYHERFVATVLKAMKNAYLGVAWRLVKSLEDLEDNDWKKHIKIRKKIQYNLDKTIVKKYGDLPDELKINWQLHVIRPLKKGIGLMRKYNSDFEKQIFHYFTIEEAIINFQHPNDTINKLNEKYSLSHDNFIRLYISPTPYLIAGRNLLRNLRNFSAHGIHNRSLLDEDDGKFAMYFSLRSLIGSDNVQSCELLTKVANKMFPDHSIQGIKKEDIRTLLNNITNQNISEKDKFYKVFLENIVEINWEKGPQRPLRPDWLIISKIYSKYND